MNNMEYPLDESDLTAEQMDALMAGAKEVHLVPMPLYEFLGPVPSYGGATVVADASGVAVDVTVSSPQEYAFAK